MALAARDRPDPAELLTLVEADEKRRARGKLKIFFGSSAGVGKTYAMLSEARRRLEDGVDIVIGLVETHERPETKALLADMTILPRKEIYYRDVAIHELDLDAVLRRKPAIALIDELAHTNAPGMRHPKRWNDIAEVLDAGIDVYTTLNVQHLESLNDVITSITGIAVRETVPDTFFDGADDIVFVDAPPDELLSRLKDGKVYIAPGANDRALQNFFKKTNLQSLRELALRRVADYVDIEADIQRRREGMAMPNTAGDKILVCIGPDMFAAKLVRTGRRMAAALKAPWTVLYVETPNAGSFDLRLRQHMQHILRSAETNGADVVTLQGARIGEEIIAYARRNGITKIIIGKVVDGVWFKALRGRLGEYILRNSGDIDVYVVTTPASIKAVLNAADEKEKRTFALPWNDCARAAAFLGLVTLLGTASEGIFKTIDISMLYLLSVMIASTFLDRKMSIAYSVGSIAAFDFFFVPPKFTFSISDFSYSLTFAVMFFTSLVISSLASKLKDNAALARRRERETQIFYSLTRELNATRKRSEMSAALLRRITDTLPVMAAVWFSDEDDTIHPDVYAAKDIDKEKTVIRWCFEKGAIAGVGTNTMPSAEGLYLPLKGEEKVLGVLGIYPKDGFLRPEEQFMLETFASLLSAAVESARRAEMADKATILAEKERLRNTLLSSVSHDLRSPLAAIRGAAETLLAENAVSKDVQLKLMQGVRDESERLTKIITNLLDITRIEGGQLNLNVQAYYPAEIIGTAIESCRSALARHHLELDVAVDLPLVHIDGLLITQAIQNLLENAAFHTPAGSRVRVSCKVIEKNLQIVVEDNGPGIAPGNEMEIFKKFATMQSGDRHKGTGLGLAICQAIVMAHLGKIHVERSDLGGARFVIDLPALLSKEAGHRE